MSARLAGIRRRVLSLPKVLGAVGSFLLAALIDRIHGAFNSWVDEMSGPVAEWLRATLGALPDLPGWWVWLIPATVLGLILIDAWWNEKGARDVAVVTSLDDLKDAPHLLWSNVRAVKHGHAYEVRVLCNNVGRIAQLVPVFTWVTSTVDVLGDPIPDTNPIQTTVTQQEETIEFIDFDAAGQIQSSSGPGPFTLLMRCTEQDPIPGEREIRWRMTYMDDDMSRGYITECSARIAFVGIGDPKVIGTPALDNTSRKRRNDDYNDFMRDKRAPSTGPRRQHEAVKEDAAVDKKETGSITGFTSRVVIGKGGLTPAFRAGFVCPNCKSAHGSISEVRSADEPFKCPDCGHEFKPDAR